MNDEWMQASWREKGPCSARPVAGTTLGYTEAFMTLTFGAGFAQELFTTRTNHGVNLRRHATRYNPSQQAMSMGGEGASLSHRCIVALSRTCNMLEGNSSFAVPGGGGGNKVTDNIGSSGLVCAKDREGSQKDLVKIKSGTIPSQPRAHRNVAKSGRTMPAGHTQSVLCMYVCMVIMAATARTIHGVVSENWNAVLSYFHSLDFSS